MKKNKNIQKEYIVIGLGRFGRSIAKQLEANGCKVLAIDRHEKQVHQISEYVTLAMCVDVTNEEALQELGGRNFDGAIISIGHSLDASVLAAIWAKEQGIPLIIAKAYDEMQGKILTKIGVDEIIYPEKEMGIHLANDLAFSNLFDAIELTAEYSIADVCALQSWTGKNLKELKLREKYGVNVIAIKRNGALVINPDADTPTRQDDIFVLLGLNSTLKKIANISHSDNEKE
ncbi:MAG: TrkA family potassium uptake protein [Bacillus sp. (in: Bacteria)]|nr:TrkA family potassium uptake protein [Bacillus sp. (in: firmicutes)]MCM1426910.1 TrkA family potassium uptake protein [Eubacterium sp.]